MRICPVCESKCDTLVCARCGFDGSRDYESWPTLASLGGPVESIAKRRNAFDALAACGHCGGTSFHIDSATGQVICENCRKPWNPVSGAAESAGETVVDEAVIPVKKKSRRWKWFLGPVAACLLVVLAVVLYHPRDGWSVKFGNTYFYEDGQKAVGMETIGDDVYYFYSDGRMHTGWLTEDNTVYYFNDEGIMQTGLVQIGDETYYFDENGVYDDEKMLQGDIETQPTAKPESAITEPSEELTQPTAAETTAPETIPPTTSPPYIPPVYTPPVTTPPGTTPPETVPDETICTNPDHWSVCYLCEGDGLCRARTCSPTGMCSTCGGTGIWSVIDYETGEETGETAVCPSCEGDGLCSFCRGTLKCWICGGEGGWSNCWLYH